MSEHTKGRLTFRELRGDDGCGYLEDETGRDIVHHGDSAVPAEENRANGRRLVACWNACQGIETQYLETTTSLREADIKTKTDLIAEREELIAMLDRLCKVVPEPQLVSMGYDSPPEHRNQEEFEIGYALSDARDLLAKYLPKDAP